MEFIEIKTQDKISKIYIGESLKNIRNYLPQNKKIIVITDENIIKYYYDDLKEFPLVVIGLGERSKTIQTLEFIFDKFIEYETDRSTFILAVGGGIVTDVAGFAASIYMRGLSFGYVSTTLLSQVDASVGGKTGVNFQRYKNMIGVFNQPDFVICDTSMLKTLDERNFIAGFAEIIKSALIKNYDLFEFLKNNYQSALEKNNEVINKLVYESVKIKADVVINDEKETKGERRILNFGHTFAHALEKVTDILHGEAVSIGMVISAKISNKMGFLSYEEVEKILKILKNYKLPVFIDVNMKELFHAIKQDKKKELDTIHFVLIDKIGHAFTYQIELNKIEELLYDLYTNN